MTEIKEDVLDIVQRIKGIDSGYKVYRNHKKHRFEVYKTYGMSEKLELTWVGKYEQKEIEPRILVENPELSYGNQDTGNMLIHGDNLIALKALEQDYAGKNQVCIY